MNSRSALPWFCLMGPTAAGKTALACELLQHFPFELISIDSAMIYRDMNIGSAKPEPTVLAQAPHHLIDILSPEDTYSVAQCCADVLQCGQAIEARGNIPLLVGGTMMYFRALQQGLSALPTADPELRNALTQQAQEQGWAALHQRLATLDPTSAQRIHPHDTQRLLRALEVCILTQKPLSAHWQSTQHTIGRSFINLILMPADRSQLHAHIAERFKDMIQAGLVDEVQTLQQKYALTAAHPAMRCVGYRQVWEYLAGQHPLSWLEEKGIAATRQLAKRQLTWLRHWPDGQIFSSNPATNLREMIAFIQQNTHN